MRTEERTGILLPLARIVAPIDFGESSYEALRAADELARYFTAELILVHVVDLVFGLAPGHAPHEEGVDAVGLAEKRLHDVARTRVSPGTKHRTIVVAGSTAESIVHTAEEELADLLVMATRGRTGVKRLLSASIVEKVVRTSSCPVLTVRGGDEG